MSTLNTQSLNRYNLSKFNKKEFLFKGLKYCLPISNKLLYKLYRRILERKEVESGSN